MVNTMTKREFLEKIVATVEDVEIVEFAEKEIEALNRKNEKAKGRKSSKTQQNEKIVEIIFGILEEEPKTCNEISEILQGEFEEEFSNQRVSALMRNCMKLHEDVEKVKVKIDKRERVGYKRTSEN